VPDQVDAFSFDSEAAVLERTGSRSLAHHRQSRSPCAQRRPREVFASAWLGQMFTPIDDRLNLVNDLQRRQGRLVEERPENGVLFIVTVPRCDLRMLKIAKVSRKIHILNIFQDSFDL